MPPRTPPPFAGRIRETSAACDASQVKAEWLSSGTALRMARLELIITSGDSVLDAFQFDGKTDAAAGAWLDSKLHALGLKPASGVNLPYALPDYPTGGRSHDPRLLGRELGELSAWFGGP